jgi:hypothetical protein
MYLHTLDEQPGSDGGRERRRYPRVKPDRSGQFDAEELEPEIPLVRNLLARPKRKNPWLIATGGAVVGVLASLIVFFGLQAGGSSTARVETVERAAAKVQTGGGEVGWRAAKDPGSDVAVPAPQARPTSTAAHRDDAAVDGAPGRAVVARANVGAPEPRNRGQRLPAATDANGGMVPMPGPEIDGAMTVVPLSGSEAGEEAPALIVLQ